MVSHTFTEQELPHLVFDRLKEETGLPFTFEEKPDVGIDGVIELEGLGKFMVEIRHELRKPKEQHIVNQLTVQRNQFRNGEAILPWLIITRYLSPVQRTYLRENHFFYADLAGNAYLENEERFILIEGRGKKDLPTFEKEAFFTPAFMRLVFAYLINPDLLSFSYREQKDQSGVGLGTISLHLPKLEQAGYIKKGTNQKWEWENLPGLAERWIDTYPQMLLPQLGIGQYKLSRSYSSYDDWRNWFTPNSDLQWGAEPAGAWMTDYLQPALYTLYTRLPKRELMKKLKLIPDNQGPIYVRGTFWPESLSTPLPTVPPILVYADLMASKDGRNRQIAHMIHERYLTNLFPTAGQTRFQNPV